MCALLEFLTHFACRIIDMVNAWTAATDQPFISFEYFPPRTDEGVAKVRRAAAVICWRLQCHAVVSIAHAWRRRVKGRIILGSGP